MGWSGTASETSGTASEAEVSPRTCEDASSEATRGQGSRKHAMARLSTRCGWRLSSDGGGRPQENRKDWRHVVSSLSVRDPWAWRVPHGHPESRRRERLDPSAHQASRRVARRVCGLRFVRDGAQLECSPAAEWRIGRGGSLGARAPHDRPRCDVGTFRRHRRRRTRSLHLLRGLGYRRRLEDGEQRRHLRADLRTRGDPFRW